MALSVANMERFDFADTQMRIVVTGVVSLDTNLDDDILTLSVYGTVDSGTFTAFPFESTLNGIYNNDSTYNP